MTSLAHLCNSAFSRLLDLLVLPFRSLEPIWPLAVLSVLTGLGAVVLYGRTSDQRRIRDSRRRLQSLLLGIRLHRNRTGVLFRLLGELLAALLSHLRITLLPLAVTALPLLLLLIQLEARYGGRPLRAGEAAVVEVRLPEGEDPERLSELTLLSGGSLAVESRAVRIASRGKAAWRVRVLEEGVHSLTVRSSRGETAKRLVAAAGAGPLSPVRTGEGPLALLLNPGEPPIEAGIGIASVRVAYPAAGIRAGGFRVHWLAVFLAVSLTAAILFKGPLGVEF